MEKQWCGRLPPLTHSTHHSTTHSPWDGNGAGGRPTRIHSAHKTTHSPREGNGAGSWGLPLEHVRKLGEECLRMHEVGPEDSHVPCSDGLARAQCHQSQHLQEHRHRGAVTVEGSPLQLLQ